MSHGITSFGLLALIAVLGAQTLGIAFVNGESVSAIERESINFDESELVDKAGDAERFADVTVTYEGSELVEGSDYEFNSSTGALERLDGSGVPANETVKVSYDWFATSDEGRAGNSVLGTLVGAWPVLILALAVLAVIGRVA